MFNTNLDLLKDIFDLKLNVFNYKLIIHGFVVRMLLKILSYLKHNDVLTKHIDSNNKLNYNQLLYKVSAKHRHLKIYNKNELKLFTLMSRVNIV